MEVLWRIMVWTLLNTLLPRAEEQIRLRSVRWRSKRGETYKLDRRLSYPRGLAYFHPEQTDEWNGRNEKDRFLWPSLPENFRTRPTNRVKVENRNFPMPKAEMQRMCVGCCEEDLLTWTVASPAHMPLFACSWPSSKLSNVSWHWVHLKWLGRVGEPASKFV